ncbi:hypothetical protein FOMG_10108 [Fusarium oxysporum f. sp. melonis 26406]|uniref:Uncharacterized protein n=1 Tax=Fusarium oxysporum f. sp. melonis 26406 TaxID=1089452 RepID=W9ZSC6_FUSOX|nr:hypothetical protein FOMG_10108 [Fusarium oxysporum f. sp. melonis 26406]
MGKIVGKFKAGALRGIAAPHASLTGCHFDELARSGAHLTSLRLNKYSFLRQDSSALTSLSDVLINRISNDFPQLESLNIYDKTRSGRYTHHMNDRDRYRWCRKIDKVASSLPTLTNGAWNMSEESSEDPSQEYLFPNVLKGYTYALANRDVKVELTRGTSVPSSSISPPPSAFKRIPFSGTLRKLAHDMRSFLSGEFKHLMMTILPALKSVTIRFEPRSPAEESKDSHLSTNRIAVISEFISKLSSIDLISFDNQVRSNHSREIAFTEALGNTPQWNGPKAVIFCGRRNLRLFSAIINQFAPNTVKAAQLPQYTAKRHPLALKSACPLLKGLRADVSAITSRSRTLACMSSNTLRAMNRDFPHLEALVLDQVDAHMIMSGGGRIYKKPYRPNLMRAPNLAQRSMSRLRRYAFTLQQYWLCKEYDCELFNMGVRSLSGDESDDPLHATSEPNEWPYWLPTAAQQEKWHSELITRILEAVPQLKELCIVLDPLEYHRGTKTENIVTVRRVQFGYLEKPSQFPYVLADID